MILVALPNLRQGSQILTPDGQRAIKRAKQQAKRKPLAAAGSTWHGLVALKRLLARLGGWIARVWAPISTALHGLMDQLEARDAATGNKSEPESTAAGESEPTAAAEPQPQPEAAAEPAPRQDRFDVARVIGNSSVGRPRSTPAISGPIPEITGDRPVRAAVSGSGTDPRQRTIDLRDAERSDADQEAGSARRAR
jgi:hypothetical protein